MKKLLILLSFLILGLLLIVPADADSISNLPKARTERAQVIHQRGLPAGRTRGSGSSGQFYYLFAPPSGSSNQSPTIYIGKGANSNILRTGVALSGAQYNYNFVTKDITVTSGGTTTQYSPSIDRTAWANVAKQVIRLNNEATQAGNSVNPNFGASPALGAKDAKKVDQMISFYTQSLENAMTGPRRVSAGVGK